MLYPVGFTINLVQLLYITTYIPSFNHVSFCLTILWLQNRNYNDKNKKLRTFHGDGLNL